MEHKMIKIEHNIETGEIIETELTEEEIAEIKATSDLIAERQAILNQELAAKAHEKAALLAKLGITEEEAQLLLGGN